MSAREIMSDHDQRICCGLRNVPDAGARRVGEPPARGSHVEHVGPPLGACSPLLGIKGEMRHLNPPRFRMLAHRKDTNLLLARSRCAPRGTGRHAREAPPRLRTPQCLEMAVLAIVGVPLNET